jgi:hypothetical protein
LLRLEHEISRILTWHRLGISESLDKLDVLERIHIGLGVSPNEEIGGCVWTVKGA